MRSITSDSQAEKEKMADQLILFTRYPRPGKVKTRMVPALGETGAARLHDKLTRRCLDRLLPLCANGEISFSVFYTGGSRRRMQAWLPGVSLVRQTGTDLGKRMIAAFSHARTRGKKRILLMGSDCPDLSAAVIRQGLTALRHHDLVIGPAHDGGYYLIGIGSRYAPADLHPLMDTIAWGTANVLADTIARIKNAGISYALLPLLHDIDRPEDLEYFDYYTRS